MKLSKTELLKEIYKKNPQMIDSYPSDDMFLSIIFYHSHATKKTINGLRLTSLGHHVLSSIYTPYVYGEECNLTSFSIITLCDHLNGPWYLGKHLVFYDIKDFSKLNLYGDFDRFIKSYHINSN